MIHVLYGYVLDRGERQILMARLQRKTPWCLHIITCNCTVRITLFTFCILHLTFCILHLTFYNNHEMSPEVSIVCGLHICCSSDWHRVGCTARCRSHSYTTMCDGGGTNDWKRVFEITKTIMVFGNDQHHSRKNVDQRWREKVNQLNCIVGYSENFNQLENLSLIRKLTKK